MLFQTDIDKINAEIAQLQELIAAKQQRQSQLVHIQNIADQAVKSVQNVIGLLSSPDARVTLKSAIVGLFDGIDESSDTTPTPSASVPVSVLEPEATPAPSEADSEPESEEDIPEATTDHCLNGRVTGNEISHASPKAGDSAAVIPALVAPQIENLEPGDLVGSLLVPDWTYRVVEARPNGQLNCKRLLSSGESFNVDIDINEVYLVEKAAYVAPEPEPEPESLVDTPINTHHTQAAQSESAEEEPTAAPLEEPMTPEKLAEFIRAAWSWEEIEAITASNEQYKQAAWSLLTQNEKDQVLELKLESQQKEKPTPEPEPPRASVQ